MGSEIFNTPGADTWTCPAGVTLAQIQLGAGGGGGGANDPNTAFGRGGGGGAGATKVNYAVTPAAVYDILVGAGGVGGTVTGNGDAGGTSYFESTSICAAGGGGGGDGGEGSPGAGGSGIAGTSMFNGSAGVDVSGGAGGGGLGGSGGAGGTLDSSDVDGFPGADGFVQVSWIDPPAVQLKKHQIQPILTQ